MNDSYLVVSHLPLRYIVSFFQRIHVTERGCWNWSGRVTAGEYGRARFNNRLELTHRLMYAWLVEPIPRGVGSGIPQLDHLACDNPRCCNPAHLRLVSGRENSLRSKGNPIVTNAAKTHCVRGHPLPNQPNDLNRGKRYCVQCSRNDSKVQRDDEGFRDFMKGYLRDYRQRRMNGPERSRLLESARVSTRRQNVLKKLRGLLH